MKPTEEQTERAVTALVPYVRGWGLALNPEHLYDLAGDVTERDRELASNALDALDRLHDRESTTVDVWALAEATADAVSPGQLADVLRSTASQLSDLLRAGLSQDEQHGRALSATDELRNLVADIWSETAAPDAAERQARARQ